MEQIAAHPNDDLIECEDRWTAYSSVLALEMYLAGTRDGGRVCHAFVTGDLPEAKKSEEVQHEQTDA